MEFPIQAFDVKSQDHDFPKKLQDEDAQMTSSTVSSLSSPVDSGVQLLDSESDLTSVMSVSGYACEIENISPDCNKISQKYNLGGNFPRPEHIKEEKRDAEKLLIEEVRVMTKSDIINQNVYEEYKKLSSSAPSYFDDKKYDIGHSPQLEHQQFSDDVFEMEHPIKNAENPDIMNVSLTSYELLDYTLQNKNLTVENTDMHVSLSEEVNENLRLTLNTETAETQPVLPIQTVSEEIPISDNKCEEEQIVFRRQRKKKSKSDTPKKRVSFHEDILNSTKIDDIHINHGFITHEPEVSLSFFQRGFIRKPDVIKGRYSWAAEGDAPYYERPSAEREVKSDIYINRHKNSSTSSSSTGSSTSSIDEEDSDETFVKKEPSLKSKPKSSCLKKSKHPKKYIDTNIVQEEITIKKKKSETNLLDTNIFGSLKNILNFSSSVPLAERGVPEGQEDLSVYSSSHDGSNKKSLGDLKLRCFETIEIPPPAVNKLNEAKNNLKLTKSEGFYPTYPNVQQNLPGNIILCDSNVYEHKGISYSYEYDKFQKTFEQQQKPKSSTVYQMILKEFNFFRRRAREEQQTNPEDDFEIISNNASTPVKSTPEIEQVEEPQITEAKPSASTSSNKSSKMEWSDNETISDFVEPPNPRHLSSPKRKISKTNHYSISNSYKAIASDRMEDADIAKSLPYLKSSSSKSSLINRFLKNVTLKKMLDAKVQCRQKSTRRVVNLYIKGIKQVPKSEDIDQDLENEVAVGRNNIAKHYLDSLDKKMVVQFRKDIFRNRLEKLHRVFHVRSAYTTDGESRPLLVVLTDNTLYIVSSKPTGTFTNHFVLPYIDLDTILIGPQGQTIHFSNYDKEMQCLISTGCTNLTGDLVGQLEIAMRKDTNKPRLSAVRQLTMRDMVNLRKSICKSTSVHKDEEYFYYSIVNVQDCTSDLDPTPLGPSKEGPLMFKTQETESARWETAYFILKAGVLYMLSSPSQKVPMRVFPLINGSCQGARRIANSARPHTFQVIIEGKSILLAAPNEYVASEWLQELVHAASGVYNNQREKNPTQSCSLLMTSEHILTVREAFPTMLNSLLTSRSRHEPFKGTQALSCASIVNLTAFRLPSAEQSWCILEFACREVHEYSGDWILYFSTNVELEKFISTLENLWHYNNESGESFPLNTIPETDPLSKKCVDVYTSLIGTWPSISSSVLLQFFSSLPFMQKKSMSNCKCCSSLIDRMLQRGKESKEVVVECFVLLEISLKKKKTKNSGMEIWVKCFLSGFVIKVFLQ